MTIYPAKRFAVINASGEVELSCDTVDEALGFMYGAACAEDEYPIVREWSSGLYVADAETEAGAHSPLCPCRECVKRGVASR